LLDKRILLLSYNTCVTPTSTIPLLLRNNARTHLVRDETTTINTQLRPLLYVLPFSLLQNATKKHTENTHTHTLGPGQDENRQGESLQKTQTNQKERKKCAAEEERDEQEATKRGEREAYRKLLCEVVEGHTNKKRRRAGTDHCSTAAGRQPLVSRPAVAAATTRKTNNKRPRLRALWQQTTSDERTTGTTTAAVGASAMVYFVPQTRRGAKKEGRLKGSRDKEKGSCRPVPTNSPL
jgi:hypothetical protein